MAWDSKEEVVQFDGEDSAMRSEREEEAALQEERA